MRGIVSLAAALALPLTTSADAPFPFRSLIILITFMLILATLVLHGLSLTPLISALDLEQDRTWNRRRPMRANRRPRRRWHASMSSDPGPRAAQINR